VNDSYEVSGQMSLWGINKINSYFDPVLKFQALNLPLESSKHLQDDSLKHVKYKRIK
jgi:hypothetical protein